MDKHDLIISKRSRRRRRWKWLTDQSIRWTFNYLIFTIQPTKCYSTSIKILSYIINNKINQIPYLSRYDYYYHLSFQYYLCYISFFRIALGYYIHCVIINDNNDVRLMMVAAFRGVGEWFRSRFYWSSRCKTPSKISCFDVQKKLLHLYI